MACQPKVFGVPAFMDISLLIFRFFLKQKYFFRYDNPERACWVCVYVLNSPQSHTGTRAQVRGSSSTWPGGEGGPPAACQGQARLQGFSSCPGRAGICSTLAPSSTPDEVRVGAWCQLGASQQGSHGHTRSPSEGCPGKAGQTSVISTRILCVYVLVSVF